MGITSRRTMNRCHSRGATARPPAQLLRLHRHSLSNLLVLGGTESQRLAVARAFHRWSPLSQGPFVALDCMFDEPRLWRALQSWLTAGGPPFGANPLHACRRGMLYLESVGSLSDPSQRLLLIFARQLEPGSPAVLVEPRPLRLAVGNTEDLSEAVDRRSFSSALYDCLDKIRVEIGRIPKQGVA